MVAEDGRTDSPLEKVLFDEANRFDFFQAVRLLERIYSERQPVGRASEPSREAVRFRTRVSLNFPPSQIHQINKEENGDENRSAQMEVAFMGLTGPLGVLPYHYTELLLERIRYRSEEHTSELQSPMYL